MKPGKPIMRAYLPFVALPLLAVAAIAASGVVALSRRDRRELTVALSSGADRATIFRLGDRAGASSVRISTIGEGEESGVILYDDAMIPDPGGQAPAGPFDLRLDAMRDAAIGGASVVIGYRCLSGTENPRFSVELSAWADLGRAAWLGSYHADLASTDVPEAARSAYRRSTGTDWPYSGPGVALVSADLSRALALRRGVELDDEFLVAEGDLDGIGARALLGSRFLIAGSDSGAVVRLRARFGLLEAGEEALAEAGIPESFPLATERPYGAGRVWAVAYDAFGGAAPRAALSPAPSPGYHAAMALDEPLDDQSRASRLTVPLWRSISLSASRTDRATSATASFRAGERYIERASDGGWNPWFVKGVNLGPASPGRWFGDPPVDEASYRALLDEIAAAGFDSVRLYTLLPPAFYRALVAWNSASDSPLYLIQEIWPDEDVPGHDLGDPEYLAGYLAESDRTIDAVFGRADIPERGFRAWGRYRADASPWLAAVLVGRELLPEEALATAAARPDERFSGRWFSAEDGHPVEAVLARMAEAAAERIAGLGDRRVPVGFVSWPPLDPLSHPSEWAAGAEKAPYNDRASIDFRRIRSSPGNDAGFFVAFHIYPNYPDFMIRSERYELPGDERGYLRYGAYLDELLSALDGIPLLVAEFGLATGYGTAHVHPEGLDHGGLSEGAQAAGLIGLYRTIAASGATGGVVFQLADEWAKKTWTTEPYMIPFDRNPLWHNAVDPEQNYGVLAWSAEALPGSEAADGGLRAWSDPMFLNVRIGPEALPDSGGYSLYLGFDTVPGRLGEWRLAPSGPLAPQGSEFVVRASVEDGRLVAAELLAQADYNRGGGRLYPRESYVGGFTRMLAVVNAASRNAEGRSFRSVWSDAGALAVGPGGLAESTPDGGIVFRLPWSLLNFSDPSGRRVLLDPIRDARAVAARDSLSTVTIGDVGVWGYAEAAGSPLGYVPERDRPLRAPLAAWEAVESSLTRKAAHSALAGFLPGWDPLAEVAIPRSSR
ncbi:MAG: hypothetical protein H7A27_11170 [Spirochaetaceae bacterium]|nr:hypothetical protein [Spirochaetaceae bacterium]